MAEGDKDDPVTELADDAKRMVAAFGDEVDVRVNKILDERLRVSEENKTDDNKSDDESENGGGGEGKPAPSDDEKPAPKTLAERLGF